MTNILNFININSGVLFALLLILAGLGKAIIEKNKQKMFSGLYDLIGEAEKDYPLGKAKFEFVLNTAYNRIPKLVRFFISKDDIKRGIEFALSKIKAYSKLHSIAIQATETLEAIKTDNAIKETIQAVEATAIV